MGCPCPSLGELRCRQPGPGAGGGGRPGAGPQQSGPEATHLEGALGLWEDEQSRLGGWGRSPGSACPRGVATSHSRSESRAAFSQPPWFPAARCSGEEPEAGGCPARPGQDGLEPDPEAGSRRVSLVLLPCGSHLTRFLLQPGVSPSTSRRLGQGNTHWLPTYCAPEAPCPRSCRQSAKWATVPWLPLPLATCQGHLAS